MAFRFVKQFQIKAQLYKGVRLFSSNSSNTTKGRCIIIGGGPCGTTTALALNRLGIECHIFEKKSNRVGTAGGSFIVHGGGTCLKHLGVEEQYKDISSEINKIIYTTIDSQHLYTLTNNEINETIDKMLNENNGNNNKNDKFRLNSELIRGVMRSDIYNMLQNECNKNNNNIYLNSNKEFDKYESLSNGNIKVWFKDGTNIIGDFMLGCDGTNSKVRKQFLNELGYDNNYNPCNYSGYSVWESVGNLSDIKDDLLSSPRISEDMKLSVLNNKGYTINYELNDASMVFFNILPKLNKFNFFLGINNNILKYNMLNQTTSVDNNNNNNNNNNLMNDIDWEDTNKSEMDDKRIEMQDFMQIYQYNPFFYECSELCQRIYAYDIHTTKLPSDNGNNSNKTISWYNNSKVLLLGDAVHSVTPYGGQGCNEAIYSAITLSHLFENNTINLNNKDNVLKWFDWFYKTRSVVTDPAIQASLKLGELLQSSFKSHGQRNSLIKSGKITNLMVKSWMPNTGLKDLTI